jgi:hypothetical protein
VSPCMAYLLLCDAMFFGLATQFYACVFSKHLCFFHLRVFVLLFNGLYSLFMPKKIGVHKLFAKLGYCRTLCSFLSGRVVNYSQCSQIILLSKLTTGAAKPLTRPEEVLPVGPRSATDDCLASACFRTLSTLQAKPRCSLDGFSPWVAPSLSTVGRYALV